jgi:epoxide hydrolase 4
MEHAYAEVNHVRLHYVTAGGGPPLIFLHGFPEFWYAWRAQLAHFAPRYRAVAPDMRGYNLSEKPHGLEAYALPTLAADIVALIDHLGHPRAALVGHDWGGVVAWACAQLAPDRISRLVVINAPHLAIFARELANSPEQRRASAYIERFQLTDAEDLLAADRFAALDQALLGSLIARGALTEADRAAYHTAWSQPGALTGMLSYYRATDVLGGVARLPPLALRPVTTPTLVIWGEQDRALLPGNLDGLAQYAPDLQIARIPDASHWVVHEQPARVSALIAAFLDGAGPTSATRPGARP